MTTPLSSRRKLDDWLSPILIKELRQGMRARAFVISFLLLQVFLCVLVIGNVAAQNDHQTLEVQNHFFWVIVGFALLVLMPLRGLVAISQEVKNRTMETILLTRLTAWRVVFGKWTALFAQSLLFVSAVLPYVVLRYFIGGDDIVSDLVWLLLTLWLSALLTAGSIAVSGLGNAVVRIVVLVAGIGAVSTVLTDVGSTTTFHDPPLEVIGWLVIFGLFIPGLLFELTASSIAPASENHAIRRRLIALFFLVSACLMESLISAFYTTAIAVPLIVLVATCYFELAEKPRLLPRMAEAFARRGALGRVAALFFLPGWPSALLFSLVVIPLTFAFAYPFIEASTEYPGWVLITSTLGSVLAPAFICHLFWPKNNQVLLMTALFNLTLLGVASLLEGLSMLVGVDGMNGHSLPIDKILAFVPSLPVCVVVMNSDNTTLVKYGVWYFCGNSLVLAFLIVGLLLASRSYFFELWRLMRAPAPGPSAEVEPKPAPETT